MELSPEQIMLVGLLASAIVFVLKMLANYFGFNPGRGPLTIFLYLVSLGLSGFWSGVFLPQFPPYVDPVSFAAAVLQFAADLITMATPILGMATLIYNILYERVFAPAEARIHKAFG